MSDWFKHFFGFHRNREGISDHFQENTGIDGEEDIDREGLGSFYHHHPFAEASDMFKHFEEMFKHFESLFQNIGHEDFPLPSIEPEEHHMEERRRDNLRDKMLKIPDPSTNGRKDSLFGGWTEEPKMDTDLDAKVAMEPLDQIIPEISLERPKLYEKHSYNSSVSVRISSENGKIKEHRTVKDSDGNVNVTVRRSLGDQTHVITTKSNVSGQSERKEDFINMDEENLNDFEHRWQMPRHLPLPGHEDLAINPRDDVLREKNSSYFDIIRRFFGKDPSCN